MSIPSKATGYGEPSTARNVFRLTFSKSLALQPVWEAYDGGTYPAQGILTSTDNDVFVGTAGNGNKPMLGLVATSLAAPTASWLPAAPVLGGAVANRLKGQNNWVIDPTIPTAGTSITFNMVLEVPSDASPSATMGADLLSRFTYSGAAPSLTWSYNDSAAGGTEGSPVWTTWTPGTHGIRHCQTGTVSGGPYTAKIPVAGVQTTTEGWVTP